MARIQITGTPKRQLQSDDRSKSTIEAEKGETIVTNSGLDNIIEHFVIGGQKHSKGGTPLEAPEGAFVFSDKKSMKVSDKEMLTFFGESIKKALTPADIAKKYDLNSLKMKLKDPTIDKITRASLQMTFENMLAKLSALAIVQESMKGTPQGHTKMFDPIMQRTGMQPGDLLGTSPMGGQPSAMEQATQMAFGGGVNLPKFAGDENGSTVTKAPTQGTFKTPYPGTPRYEEWEAYTPKGATQLNSYLQAYGLPLVNTEKVNPAAMKQMVNQLQMKIINTNPALVYHYMTRDENGSHQPNNKLEDMLGKKGYSKDAAGLQKALADKAISQSEVLEGYNDQKWWYRAVSAEKQKVDKETYDKFMKENPNGIPQGDYTYFPDPSEPGHFIAYTVDDKGEYKVVPADPKKPEDPLTTTAAHLGQGMQEQRNMDFYFQDKNNLKNIARKRSRLKKYDDFTPTPELAYTDQAYYSPERAIHAIGSQLASGIDSMTAFGDQQSQTANFLGMQGQAFDKAAQEISRYADMNVQAYNQERTFNTEIANKKAMINSEAARSSYNNKVNADKAWTRDLNLLDDMLTAGVNKAVSNRADRLNLEKSIGEQYKIDPNTGIAYYDKGRMLDASAQADDELAAEINDLMTQVAGLSAADATRAVMAKRSGKWEMTPNDGMTLPNELPKVS